MSGSKRYKSTSLFLPVALVLAIFTLLFLVSSSYSRISGVAESEKRVVHSHKIRIALEQLISHVKDAETGQSGFMLTNDSVFLKPYRGAFEKTMACFDSLKVLNAQNPAQLKNLDSVQVLLKEKFAILSASMQSYRGSFKTSDSLNRQFIRGKNLMEILRARVNKMITLESQQLRKCEGEHRNEISLTPVSFLLTALFSLFIFVVAFFRINKDVKELKKTNNQLSINKEIFEHSEQIAEISNWCWNLEKNILTYSNNQYRLLGCEPKEFEPTMENFLAFVHPDDRHILIEDNQRVLEEKIGSIAFFRIIRKDSELRYFKSIGKMITDDYNKQILIVVNADITEQYINDKTLEEKLFDLERSNKELSAFNHVASHDLQEPLRKVQTLISIIKERDYHALSEKAQENFNRIQVAANRMQKLITDLLLFSRTNKADKVFETVDLNEILEQARQELSEAIYDKNAIIQSYLLPTLNVIPFQIRQLFINLIGNSLKYSKADQQPVITINAKIVAGAEIPGKKQITDDKKFYQISIQDNGIGFEQQYAKTIFTLFQRLHESSEYSGTGIGLAICKKIVENHKGFISADGTPNEGARFTIYLPLETGVIV